MDSPGFWAAPLTTGALKAYHLHHGRQACAMELVHFRDDAAISRWRATGLPTLIERCAAVHSAGRAPVLGFSVYTWNAAAFLALARELKTACPEALVVGGGPHVQQADDYLGSEAFDVIVLGEGEATFSELIDAADTEAWADLPGIAYLDGSAIRRTAPRPRTTDLDRLPSALEVVPLADDLGRPLYDAVAYETSRGCPFRCAFCEWGTGAIGTKMHERSLDRIRSDWERIVAAGIPNLWLADSNFGSLRHDLDKARLICELKSRTGLPKSFATSWSKKHSPRVQEIVLLLHQHGLLPHYQLALQTLTPEALRLSNRENMSANEYRPIARRMAEAGVPIAAELIWGLPGDNLADFKRNLDVLITEFPAINIFGYTLLPGTEFHAKRREYRIETVPVAGYGKVHGEYVVACHSFDRAEGAAGYFLAAAYTVLVRGHIVPLTTRYLALHGGVSVADLLCELLAALLEAFADRLSGLDPRDHMAVYEARGQVFLALLAEPQRCDAAIVRLLAGALERQSFEAKAEALAVQEIDRACRPRYGGPCTAEQVFPFRATAVRSALNALQSPDASDFLWSPEVVGIEHPGGIGSLICEPDAGSWAQGRFLATAHAATAPSGRIGTTLPSE